MKALAADDPRVIGEYRLRAQLGAGGMGQVYLGLSPAGRAVAIKVLRPDLAVDTDFLRRFAQEVASARAVSEIYTAPVVASGLNERPPWLATAFVPGPSLDQVVSEHGPLPEPALWPLLGGLVEALQAIHACGVVHRDLKPANVLLAADGPRVIDFGISRAADGTALTATGLVFGTPGYMSPEQAEGKPAGPASGVFALGCVIAFAAAGVGPFGSGTVAAVIYRVVHAEAALDQVPPSLREIISACLAKDPAARPEPRALAAAMAGRVQETGTSAVAFWPRSVTSLIGAYQATLEQGTKAPDRPAKDFSLVAASHPPTDLWSQGNGQGVQGSGGPGYPPGAGPVGYPQPYRAGPAAIALLPASVLNAVRLMYAGAAYTGIYAIGVIVVAGTIIKNHPALTSSGHNALAGVAILTVLASAIEVGVWLGIAQACRNGRNWARVTGTVLFGIHTLGVLVVLANSRPGIGLTKLLTLVGWLIACGAVVLLWRRESSAFFRATAPGRLLDLRTRLGPRSLPGRAGMRDSGGHRRASQ